MAKSKTSPKRYGLKEQMEDFNRRHPVIDERWYVVDYYPAYRRSDEYDDYWVGAKSVIASPYFKTKQEAEEWKEQHNPEEGAELRIGKDQLREWTERKWF